MEKKCTVLCVDDHQDSCEVLTKLLRLAGFATQSTPSKEGTLELIKTSSFDLLILESELADASGVELCKEIRSFDTVTPIIFYSAFASVLDQAEGMAAGANAYLIKPNDLDKLIDLVKILAPPDCTTFSASA